MINLFLMQYLWRITRTYTIAGNYYKNVSVRSEIITAVTMKNTVFWGVMPCSVAEFFLTFLENVLPQSSGLNNRHRKYPVCFLGLLFNAKAEWSMRLQTSTKSHCTILQKMPLFPCPVYFHLTATAHWTYLWPLSTLALTNLLNTLWSGIHMGELQKSKNTVANKPRSLFDI
jgi:hypothetical protein